jgi:hypothetical protein
LIIADEKHGVKMKSSSFKLHVLMSYLSHSVTLMNETTSSEI